jgi:murein DD-endopeptidase MepM/ murein hydrolase activator NlpD
MEATDRKPVNVYMLFAGLVLASCAGPASPPVAPAELPITPGVIVADIPAPPEPAIDPPARPPAIVCGGPAMQGGAIVCKTFPESPVSLNGAPVAMSDADGVVLIGLARDAPAQARVGVRAAEAAEEIYAVVEVLARVDTVANLTMECNKIAAQTPAEKRHAERSWVKKDNALKIFSGPLASFGLIKPSEGAYSSPFGATRTYTPKTPDCEPSTSVHNGQDIAIGVGGEIRAPMAGTVILADGDLYYEGGCVFLDLGHGLVSVTMHMSRIDVKAGDRVEQGQVLGLSGKSGRVTGPHLHWAIKYRNVFSPDRASDIWLDPVLLLGLNSPS